MQSQSTMEEDLEEALRKREYDYFIELLAVTFGETIKRRIKHHSCGELNIEDMRDVYQKSLIEINKKIREPGFSSERPMAFVNHLVRLRTLDARRARARQKVVTNTDDLLSAMAEVERSDGLRAKWKEMSSDDQNRFMFELRQVIAEVLPKGQRVVAQAYFDNFEKVANQDWSVLVDPITAATGQRPTVSTIRSQWRNARQTIVDELVRRGFGFLKGE